MISYGEDMGGQFMVRDLEGGGGVGLWWEKKRRLYQFDCVCLMNVQGVSFISFLGMKY